MVDYTDREPKDMSLAWPGWTKESLRQFRHEIQNGIEERREQTGDGVMFPSAKVSEK